MGGASNASLDFEPLGTVTAPLARLLLGPQPVEVDVPVHPRGESLPQIAHATLTFAVSTPPALAPAADDTDAVALVPEVTARSGLAATLVVKACRLELFHEFHCWPGTNTTHVPTTVVEMHIVGSDD